MKIDSSNARHGKALIALAASLIVLAALVATGCSSSPQSSSQVITPTTPPTGTESATTGQAPAGATKIPDTTTLKSKDLTVGTGTAVKTGDTVTVNYTGWLTDGTKFDSSLDRNQPFSFTVGANQVIQGWDQGVVGMKVGGKRELIIPPQMGYGAQGAGGVIPPNATLRFDIELVSVTPSGQ